MEKGKEIYPILIKYFNRECNDEERAILEAWCFQSEGNYKKFVSYKKAWIISNQSINDQIAKSKKKTWEKIESNISKSISNTKKYSQHTLIRAILSTAAGIATLFICGTYLLANENTNIAPQYTELYLPKGEKGYVKLPDDTEVWLNSDSRISISNQFNSSNRRVCLEGEAYFDVKRKDNHNFIVQTDAVDIVVHGTAFDVTSYSHSDNMSVSLEKGKVEIYERATQAFIEDLEPNELVEINKKTFKSAISTFDKRNHSVWRFEELVFEQENIREVFDKMENWYGVSISLINKPKDTKYRFKIKNESLHEMLQLINKITSINYEINGKEVTIKYN